MKIQYLMSKIELAFEILKSEKNRKMIEVFFKKKEDLDILYRRIIKWDTLRQAGEVAWVSRERVRQVEKRFLDKVDEIWEAIN